MEREERRRIGRALGEAREQAGLTQTEMAHKLGYSDGRVVRYWEAGERHGGFWRNLDRIVNLTGKPREFFIGSPSSDAVLEELLRQVAELREIVLRGQEPPSEEEDLDEE